MKMQIDGSDIKICLVDGKPFPDRYTGKYLMKNFSMTFDEYIIKYFLNGIIPVCQCGCATPVKIKYYNNTIFISEYTKNHWPHKKHTLEEKMKIKENTKNAIFNKYGVENVFVLKSIKEKIRITNLEKYGVENPMQNDDIKNKNHHYQTDEVRNKIKVTNRKRYGANSYTASDVGKSHIKSI